MQKIRHYWNGENNVLMKMEHEKTELGRSEMTRIVMSNARDWQLVLVEGSHVAQVTRVAAVNRIGK